MKNTQIDAASAALNMLQNISPPKAETYFEQLTHALGTWNYRSASAGQQKGLT